MRAGLVVACLAAVVAAGEHETEIRKVIADIQKAEKERDPDAALDRVDVAAFRGRVAKAGLKVPTRFIESAARRMFAVDQLGGFRNARIRMIKVAGDGKTAFCVVDHRVDELSGRMRWWLKRSADGWRLYEADVMDINLTMSESLVLGFRAAREPAVRTLVRVFRDVRTLFADEEYKQILLAIDEVDAKGLPWWARRALLVMRAAAHVALEESDAGLRIADGLLAESEPPALAHLMRAAALSQLERHAEALDAAQTYTEAVGPSAEAAYIVAIAQLRLERPAEAEAACKAALALDPDDADLLFALAIALPEDRKHEIVARLGALDDVEEMLPDIVDAVVDEEDLLALAAIAAGAEKLSKGGPVAAYARGHFHYGTEKYDAAAGSFKLAFERAGESWHDHYVLWYLDAMAEAGKVLPALDTAPDRGVAFRYLAGHLAGDDRADDLAKLVAARARDKDESAEFRLWDAQSRFDTGDYEGALVVVTRHEKLLEDVDTDHSWRVDEIRVKALVRLGRLVEADVASQDVDKLLRLVVVLAFGDVGAAAEAFKAALKDGWTVWDIWDEDDIERILTGDEKWKALREKYPKPAEDK